MDRAKFAALKAQHEKGYVVGLQDAAGLGYRVDIDVLIHDEPKTFNLFLIAMRDLQHLKRDNIMGYYQIAGIHGFPKTLWNNIAEKDLSSADWGYCAHRTQRFPTWHRPYLAMLEQALFIRMVEIADSYTDPQVKAGYQVAALKFRLPYWDYYRPRGGAVSFPGIVDNGVTTSFSYDYKLPEIFLREKIMARLPGDNSLQELDPNPLHHFSFQPTTGDISDSEWGLLDSNQKYLLNHERTTRHPWSRQLQQKSPQSFRWDSPDRLNKTLNELRMDSNRIALDMIGQDYYKLFDTFTSTGKPQKPPPAQAEDPHKVAVADAYGSSGSLEAIHGLYHGLVGGMQDGGHMARVATAAFDPVFWMHHNQIERIFCIWQSARSDDGRTNWFGNANLAKQSLYPFMRAPNSDNEPYWTSNSVRKAETFGSTYRDVKPTAAETKANFEKLYRWSVPVQRTGGEVKAPKELEPLPVTNQEFFQTKDATSAIASFSTQVKHAVQAAPQAVFEHSQMLMSSAPAKKPAPEAASQNEIWEWFVDDEVEALALNGAFSILYFINQKPGESFDDEKDYTASPELAGVTYIFAAPVEACDNCGKSAEQSQKVTNAVAITSQLLDYVEVGQLESMHPEHVRPFLIDRLRWRVMTVNGRVVDARRMARDHSLSIGISHKMTRHLPTGQPVEGEIGREDDVIDIIVRGASTTASIAT